MIDKKYLLVIIVFLLAGFIRLYNFPNRINFGPEQAISLIVSGNYLKDKFSLLGQPNIQRTTSLGHIIYSPAMFNYSLIPLLLVFNYDPVPITYYFAFLNLVTGLILFILVKRIYKYKVAFFSLVLFLFDSTMIYHSTFIWTHNYIPLLNIFIFFLLYRFRNQSSRITPFLLGLLTSLCLSPEYFYVFTMLTVFGIMIYYSTRKPADGIIFILGALLGSLPTVLFDLKHHFYHLLSVWQYTSDTLLNAGQNKIGYYHFLQFWPLLAVVGGLLLSKVYTKNKFLVYGLILIYLYINLSSNKVSLTQAVGMDKGMTISKLNQTSSIIASDNPKNFNVASLLSFDSTRAYPLRYFLQFKYNITPKGVEEYRDLNSLYVLSANSYLFDKSSVWEITVQRPYKLKQLKVLDQSYAISKLEHL